MCFAMSIPYYATGDAVGKMSIGLIGSPPICLSFTSVANHACRDG